MAKKTTAAKKAVAKKTTAVKKDVAAKTKTEAASAATLKKIEEQKAQIAELKLQKKLRDIVINYPFNNLNFRDI